MHGVRNNEVAAPIDSLGPCEKVVLVGEIILEWIIITVPVLVFRRCFPSCFLHACTPAIKGFLDPLTSFKHFQLFSDGKYRITNGQGDISSL